MNNINKTRHQLLHNVKEDHNTIFWTDGSILKDIFSITITKDSIHWNPLVIEYFDIFVYNAIHSIKKISVNLGVENNDGYHFWVLKIEWLTTSLFNSVKPLLLLEYSIKNVRAFTCFKNIHVTCPLKHWIIEYFDNNITTSSTRKYITKLQPISVFNEIFLNKMGRWSFSLIFFS